MIADSQIRHPCDRTAVNSNGEVRVAATEDAAGIEHEKPGAFQIDVMEPLQMGGVKRVPRTKAILGNQ